MLCRWVHASRVRVIVPLCVVSLFCAVIYVITAGPQPGTVMVHPVITTRTAYNETLPGHHSIITSNTETDDVISDDMLDLRASYPVHQLGVFFYAAYYDDRGQTGLVRIFGLRMNSTSLEGFQCQLGGSPAFRNTSSTVIYNEWPPIIKYYAFMMICHMDSNATLSDHPHVIIIPTGGHRHVTVPIRRAERLYRQRRELAVCVKPVHGHFATTRIIEWFEIQRAAGMTDFIVYNADLTGASRFVLEYYEAVGLLKVISFPFLLGMLKWLDPDYRLGPGLRYSLYQQLYLLALHDCVYRFSNSYEHVMILDLDEVILATADETLLNMLRRQRAKNPDVASYLFHTAWHFREFTNQTVQRPTSLLYMQTFATASLPNTYQPKSIVSTSQTVTLNYHGVLTSYADVLRHELPWKQYGYVHHYRDGSCKEKFYTEQEDVCKQMNSEKRLDPVIKRYRIYTERSVYKVMKYLNL